MARVSAIAIIFVVVLASSTEGRKLSSTEEKNNTRVPAAFPRLFLASLPKGKVPNSSPSNKGHATVIGEQLFARHLVSIHRAVTLVSVPSPGAGH